MSVVWERVVYSTAKGRPLRWVRGSGGVAVLGSGGERGQREAVARHQKQNSTSPAPEDRPTSKQQHLLQCRALLELYARLLRGQQAEPLLQRDAVLDKR